MGNTTSSESSSSKSRRKSSAEPETATERAKTVVGDIQEQLRKSVKKLDDDHPAAQLIDSVCGGYFDTDDKYRSSRSASFYSEEVSEDGSRTVSEDDTTYDERGRPKKDATSVESSSYMSQSDYDSEPRRRGRRDATSSFDTEDDSRQTTDPPLLSKPLASSFAKRCYFTKSGIGKTTQHYEGLTLTGNIVLMLAGAMKLKGCPTICDEDLRRVEQTYPNQFSRLPDELLLSSGWRRISKYCHFSKKPIPDGMPFFHSKQRLHPSGGYYFLLAGAVGMIRPIDVEPLTRDTLVLLETDFPNQCDAAPGVLIRDAEQWTLVDKFCFFSGGPINTEEDVYYQADFDGNPIYMLAFLSPSLTPDELYKLNETDDQPGLKSCMAVQEVETVYDLTDRDFDDLKLYHLGPCRALPQFILQPQAWGKVLPPHFLAARQKAMDLAQAYEAIHNPPVVDHPIENDSIADEAEFDASEPAPWTETYPVDPLDAPPEPFMPVSPAQSDLNTFLTDLPAPDPTFQHDDLSQAPQQHNQQPVSGKLHAPQAQYPAPGGQQEQFAYHQSYYEPSGDGNSQPEITAYEHLSPSSQHSYERSESAVELHRAVHEEGAFIDTNAPMDEAIASRYPVSPPGKLSENMDLSNHKMDPPEDEPPSLTKPELEEGSTYPDDSGSYPYEADRGEGGPNPADPTLSSGSNLGFDQNSFEEAPSPTSYYAPSPHLREEEDYQISSHGYFGSHSPTIDGGDYHGETSFTAESPPQPQQDQYFSDAYGQEGEASYDNDDEQFPRSPESGYGVESESGGPMSGIGIRTDQYTHNPDGFAFSPANRTGLSSFHARDTDGFDNGYFSSEEKKVGDEPDPEVEYAPSMESEKFSGAAESPNEGGFTAIKRGGYSLGSRFAALSPPASQVSTSSSVLMNTSSSIVRGAQDVLKRNRRRRIEMAMKQRNEVNHRLEVSDIEPNPAVSPTDDASAGTWDSGSDISASASSAWTDSSTNERSSRRALILQMAKARMKSNKDQKSVSGPEHDSPSAIDEERSDTFSHADSTHHDTVNDLDFAVELD